MSFFIGLEGIDGSGKSSLISPIVKKLNNQGIKAKAVNKRKIDYSDELVSHYAKTIEKLIWHGKPDPHKFLTSQGWLYLHALWYTLLVENEILPSLNKYEVVIVDGWYYKIYSKFLLKNNFDIQLLEKVIASLKKCDKVFMLDVDPSISWSRRDKYENNELGGYDNVIVDPYTSYVSHQSNIRDKMKNMASKDKSWTVINTSEVSIEQTSNILVNQISNLFKL